MTLPDPSLDRTGEEAEPVQDRVPPTERNEDPARSEAVSGLTLDGSRPLTTDEKTAAEHDQPLPERVYAPASERVPKAPVPGHREIVQDTDPTTPERQATQTSPSGEPMGGPGAFERSASAAGTAFVSTPPGQPASSYAAPTEAEIGGGLPAWMPAAWLGLAALSSGIGVWLYLRWRRERNRPINRFRRQARWATAQIQGRMPSGEDISQPVVGLLAAMVSTGLVAWRQLQKYRLQQAASHAAGRAAASLSDADFQKRLLALKARWTPRRLELEKFSISRH